MSFIHRLFNLGRSTRLSRDIDREMAFHIDERVAELKAGGMPEADARREAARQFGNRTAQGEATRDADVITWLDSVLGDLRYATRALRNSPVFTLVAVLSLALGIGANTAIYSLLDAVVLRSLPVPQPDQLVQVTLKDSVGSAGDGDGYFTNPLWEQVRDLQTGMTSVAAFGESNFNIASGGEVQNVRAEMVSGEFFNVFGVRPAVGRLLTPSDDVRDCDATAVLGHGYWERAYGGRTDVAGTRLALEGRPFEIVGVAGPGFDGPWVGREVEVYIPLCGIAMIRGNRRSLDSRSSWWLNVIGRRDAALPVEQVAARLQTIAPAVFGATIPGDWPADMKDSYATRSLGAIPAESGLSGVRDRYSGALAVLMAAVGLLLLIACANVANLLLARATSRQREMAIRLAIGASRRRVVRQLLTESALLALLGAAIGLLAAHWGTQGLVALISSDSSPVSLDLSLNRRVLGFTVVAATLTAFLFGLVPAWRGTRVSPQTAMKADARGVAEGHGRFTIGKALVVAQVALSLTLLVGAGLLIGSLRNLVSVDPGFRSNGVLLATVDFRRSDLPTEQMSQTFRTLLERVRSLPGVGAASTSDMTPISRSSWNNAVYVDGYTPVNFMDGVAWFNEVSDGYFATLGTKILTGRDFNSGDVVGGERVAIVNDAMAQKFFKDASPLGRTFRLKRGDTYTDPYTVVGVVESAKYQSLRETNSATVYLPSSQNDAPGASVTFELRSTGDPLALVSSMKRAIGDVHGAGTVQFTTLDRQLALSLQRERLLAVLSSVFGMLALGLSALGLYGVMAYTVARRRNEIGVRVALGADRGRVMRLVLGDVARVIAIGVVAGSIGAYASGRLVASFLYGLEPVEPFVMLAAAAVLAVVGFAAGIVPALRASRVEAAEALR
ncbi:MAG TPA: ABC transporter permease [Gemmatimonadaceae bacterium]|nr:ABC transporter permease [Gemmatimonadaceae bacterium]